MNYFCLGQISAVRGLSTMQRQFEIHDLNGGACTKTEQQFSVLEPSKNALTLHLAYRLHYATQ
jgi:hypothetical protein